MTETVKQEVKDAVSPIKSAAEAVEKSITSTVADKIRAEEGEWATLTKGVEVKAEGWAQKHPWYAFILGTLIGALIVALLIL